MTSWRSRGEAHPRAKLTDAQVAEILARLAAGETQTRLAGEYGVSQTHISKIALGERRKSA